MDDLQLDHDEGIVLQTTEVERYGTTEETIDEFILTNKNIFCIYEKRNGLFSKPEKIMDKIPLESIKVINGKVQIRKITHPDYGDVVQFLYKNNRREYFSFFKSNEEVEWINTINTTITGDETPVIDESKKKKLGLFSNKKNIADDRTQVQIPVQEANTESVQTIKQMNNAYVAFSPNFANVAKTEIQTNEDVSKPIPNDIHEGTLCPDCGEKNNVGARFCQSCGIPLTADDKVIERKNKYVSCKSCGAENNSGARFCQRCGALLDDESMPKKTEEPRKEEQYHQYTYSERIQEFAGKIIKCPNCGEVLNSFVSNCPACGYEVRGAKSSYSVHEFAGKLGEIEEKRETKIGSNSLIGKIWGSDGQLTKTDEQKINLIRSYSIPNTKEDIFEFMILASSNINMKLYGLGDRGVLTASQREVSDAWRAKFEQAYEKAKLILKNPEDFQSIQSVYEQINKKLKIERCKLILLCIFPIAGPFILFVLIKLITLFV